MSAPLDTLGAGELGSIAVDLLAYWRWDNYVADLDAGAGFHFNSNQSRLHSEIGVGDSLWLVTGKPTARSRQYPVVGRLVVTAKTCNPPGYKYGRYRVWGDLQRSRYLSADGPDASALLRRLAFESGRTLDADAIAQALQTIRAVTAGDAALLDAWVRDLADEPRARAVADEGLLERALARDDAAMADVLRAHRGAAEGARQRLSTALPRNRALVQELRARYVGRCQLCAFDPEVVYGAGVCEAHHITYLSRGGDDAIENMVLLCPNHHEVIHATQAVFDFGDLRYVFPRDRREPLVLNSHLKAE